jgi:ElaB/YqjD/DUF883 family membrane-anchored ribosome-binding protein
MATEYLEKVASPEDVLREFSKIKSMVAEAVDDGVRSALRAVRKGRNAAEDVYEEAMAGAKKAVKQHPLEAVGIAVAATLLAGSLVAWLTLRRR